MNTACEDFMRLLRQRHSCRSFSPRPPEARTLDALREAFVLAPQAGGGRSLDCRFVTERATIRALADAGAEAFSVFCAKLPSAFAREEMLRYGENFFWFGEAPALACITARKPPAFLDAAAGDKAALLWGGELSGAMAGFALLLAAESLGLGACCLTGPLSVWREMESRLAIPERSSLVLMIAFGYKKDDN